MSNIKKSDFNKCKVENEFNAKHVQIRAEVISSVITDEQSMKIERIAANRIDAFMRGEDMDKIRAGIFDDADNSSHDPVNHPSHYTQNKFESIDEMMIAFGPEAVYHFCICNAWKYKNRAPFKGNFEEDMKKADWYLTKAKEIKGGNLWQE